MTTDPQTTRYRHRTTEVEAVQWTGSNTDHLRAFCGRDFDAMDPMEPGDWVVKTDEDFLVFSPVDFATYYEPAVSAVPAVRPELRSGSRLDPGRKAAAARRAALETAIWDAGAGSLGQDDVDPILNAVLSVLPATTNRAAVYRELADLAEGDDGYVTKQELRRMAREAERGADPRRMAVVAQQQTEPGGRDALLQAHAALAEQAGRDQAALARVAAVLDEYEGTDWSYTFPAQRIREAVPAVTSAVAGEEPAGEWCKCRSCWGWFVEDHPGEDLDELGKDLGWWAGLPVHRDAPAVVSQPGKEPRP